MTRSVHIELFVFGGSGVVVVVVLLGSSIVTTHEINRIKMREIFFHSVQFRETPEQLRTQTTLMLASTVSHACANVYVLDSLLKIYDELTLLTCFSFSFDFWILLFCNSLYVCGFFLFLFVSHLKAQKLDFLCFSFFLFSFLKWICWCFATAAVLLIARLQSTEYTLYAPAHISNTHTHSMYGPIVYTYQVYSLLFSRRTIRKLCAPITLIQCSIFCAQFI